MTSIEPTPGRIWQLIVPALAIAAVLFGVFAVIDRLERDQHAAAQRALQARAETLNASALQQGGALACLDTLAGESTEAACEAKVFASPQSTAAAVVYTGAQLTLLADAQKFDPAFAATFAARRRAIELDRFGIAAHVLSERDGCTAERCAAFAFVTDSGVLKANMKAQAFDQYVARHAMAWNAPAALPEPAISQAQPALVPTPPKAASAASPLGEPGHQPIPDKYKLPSADSIPAVSIMNKEPSLPAGAGEAQAAAPPTEARPEATAPPESGAPVPVPPRRPQERPQVQSPQAAPPPAR
jgi:hypothetical protein